MAWVNNNKKNARFNPNRRDDRLMMSQVTSRRERPTMKREVEPEIELVSTELEHVLSMGAETRLDWLQMALMQAGLGKLKVDALYKVLTSPGFGPSEGPERKKLKANVLANLHLFNAKQKKAIQDAVNAWGSSSGGGGGGGDDRGGDGDDRDRARGRDRDDRRGNRDGRSSSSGSERRRKKHSSGDKDKGGEKEKEKGGGSGGRRKRASKSRSRSRSKSPAQSRQQRSRSRSRSRGRRRR